MGRELWEVAAACHGPEDPPAALLKAADVYREPLLVLIASCYEVIIFLIKFEVDLMQQCGLRFDITIQELKKVDYKSKVTLPFNTFWIIVFR